MPEPEEPTFERRIVSVLFADLVGFTSLSERLDPEDVATVQDAYFGTVRETIARHGGQLEKFIGDAAMAVFGVPKARDDDAERAIRAGLALVGAVELLSTRLGLDTGEGALQLRVGVNSGEVVSAESGPDQGRVTGDTVNLASRLQGAAEPGTVLVGELTSLSAADAVELAPAGRLELKGKAQPVPAWRVIGLRPERSREQAMGTLRAPMLGREAEMEGLRLALSGLDGGAAELLIVAPPGAGKSRLLAEFAALAETARAHVLRTRVRPDVIGPAEPVSQLLLSALGQSSTRQTVRESLGAALAGAGVPPGRAGVVTDEVIGTIWPRTDREAGAVGSEVGMERDARFAAWLEGLDALAGAATSVWLVEDVHWAGGDLLAFLAQAGSAPSRGGRLVVATGRPSILERRPDSAAVLELPPLPAMDAAQLVTALVGAALPRELVRTIAERSDGNPLFIEELLRSWISSGTLVGTPDGGWQLAVAPESVPLPATVQAIYAAQLDDLPAPARLVARRASVAGRRFAAQALEPLEVPEPDEALGQLRRRAFVRGPETDALGGDVYAYRHALLRDAGYASLSRAERSRYHLALATWLEQTAGTDLARVAEPIASHYEAALAAMPALGADTGARSSLTQAARLWLERAAEAALGVAAHEAAIGLLARAIDLASAEPTDAARLRLRRAELMAAAGDMAEGIAEMEAARDTFRAAFVSADAGSIRDQARAGYGHAVAALGEAMIEQIRFIEARDLTAAALDELGPPEDAIVGRLLAVHAWAMAAQGDREGTVEEAERALRLVRGGDPRIELEVRLRRGMVRTDASIDVQAEWAELEQMARSHGAWAIAIRARNSRLLNAQDGRDPRALLDDLRETIELAVSHGLTEMACWSRYAVVDHLFRLGEWDEAVALGLENVEIAERNAYHRPTFRTWMALLPILAARGEHAHLERYAAWLTANLSVFPDPPSAYGLVHAAATDRLYARAGLVGPTGRRLEPETAAADAYVNADYLAALEAIVWGWLADGVTADRVQAWLSALHAQRLEADDLQPDEPPLDASMDLMRAWTARAAGPGGADADGTDLARRSAANARKADVPWCLLRALRAIPAEELTPDEEAEARELERKLRVSREATAPPV